MSNVDFKPDTKLFGGGMQGWVCPKCGRVFAPHIHTCPNCTVKEYETTQSTTMICD